jgi:ribonuclease P protein component
MLSRTNRLKKKKDLERVFKKGQIIKEGFLVLKLIKNHLEISRFGLVVSQKISKRAAIRNKIKRRLREIIKRKLVKTKKGWDVVLVARPGLENKDFWEMEETINKLFEKAKIIKPET